MAAAARVRGVRWIPVVVVAGVLTVWWVVAGDGGAWVWAESTADLAGNTEAESADQETADLRAVVSRIRLVLIALGSALGTLFLTIAAVRWMMANGEPGAIDGAKRALTGTAIGYGIAILATVLMDILDWVVRAGVSGDGQ
ncbi:hypothetical protein Q8791_17130 [Nocardiopsis sp. CT-R113]|uniref:MotA/TolQ/ExbB proton channel domain-containing protein n=1 Tax=Nocardiopsis codii TaxID=3065942 RepID=A0ABU7K9N1_9ACTN|nr:hypothetical protein [Nocardiopsis sp. CT-R113]MEE2038944.1 hypothetical protein [Nocardiopsis sp. CT-R113]